MDNDEDINLIDLFNDAFKLTYQAGQTIKIIKNTKNNFKKILKKKSFRNLPSEPVTVADFISHSIITNGLKNKFQNLQIISEEKDQINHKDFQLIQQEFNIEDKFPKIPFIQYDQNLMNVPLSSVAVWVDPLDATKEFTEDLLQYVMVMLCITIEQKPTIGILYAPFTDKLIWAWVGVDNSPIKRDENILLEAHKPSIDEIILSRSHAGHAHEILKNIYRDKQYKIIPAAGSGYKTVQVLEEYADYYLHITPIKKWDVCAPDAILRANHGSFVVGDRHLNANGPFGKHHSIGDEPSPYTCNRRTGIHSSSTSLNIMNINVSATVYSSNDQITITWTPTLVPCVDDFVGIYFVDIDPLDACGYFDYEFVKKDENSTSWQMTNLRRQLEFRYYSRDHNCSGNYSLIAKSSIVEPSNYNEATHIHLAYGDRIDQIYVSYLTNSSEYIPQCQYGLSPLSLNLCQNGTTTTYTASDMCEGKANIWGPQTFIHPGYMHTILLENLHPSTTYFYRVGTDQHGWSQIYSFRNRPENKDESVYLIAYGDLGLSPVQLGAKSTINRVTSRIISTNVTCLLHIGDISYARGIGALWDAFMTQIQAIAARVPYMVGIGNHEYDHLTGGDKDPSGASGPGGFRPKWGNYGYDSGGECAVPMVRRFHSPLNGNSLFWYSFDVGPIHIIYYSTEHDFRRQSDQYQWIEKDLRSVNRSRTPWLIVGSHRHMYTSESENPIDLIKIMLQLYLEPLFYKYHVDINLYAHRHSYERSCRMFQHKCVDDGIVQVLIGMAGQDLDTGSYSGAEWSLFHDQLFGYTTIFANKTYLHFTYYHDNDDYIADQFQLYK
ncbi:unnamed protein product [Rotaria sordida]|uniref:Purple acid phosphatase n=1 Tax=Rotaria sordida TaxID=392033 RepID=A0A814JZS5_9BILA|nr:unnamed protein product [Rotaria sordida]